MLKWWMIPRRDDSYQWWFGYSKVTMICLGEEEKQKYLSKMNNV